MLTACGDGDNIVKSGGVSQEKVRIVTSIKPIQAIVSAITRDAANVVQLIPDYASPHDYSFKPSDIRKVQDADIVFRIDEHMETQLNGVFQNVRKDKVSIVSLASVNGLKLLESHHEQKKNSDEMENEQHQHDTHESTSSNLDFHIWTSPNNTLLMASKIASSLSELDPKNAQHYQQNIQGFFQAVKTQSEKIKTKLSPYKDKPYIVFHNSWQYFAVEFGLQPPIVVDLHEGISSGAKTVSEIRERIVEDKINCVFYDSGISLARLKVIAEKAKMIEIDVLAKSMKLDQTTYINWLTKLGNQIETCLSG